jgi:hypothetical protein
MTNTSDLFDRGTPPAAGARTAENARMDQLRAIAGAGRLAATVAAADVNGRTALTGAAFAIAWPVVYQRLTRRIELARGHVDCAASVVRMREACIDRFYDDVEAAVDDLLAHAVTPVRNVEAWIASRLNAATVDAHRRRRGAVGALQRPRLPGWLNIELGGDPWLTELAVQILTWVGIAATAGGGLWPLEAWAARRAVVAGGEMGGDTRLVARDVEAVLAMMRTRPQWYHDYVERPLGHKQTPVAGGWTIDEVPPLHLTDRADTADARLVDLASAAVAAIEARVTAGNDITAVVTEVISTVFGDHLNSYDLDRAPLTAPDYDELTAARLVDRESVERIVAEVVRILKES